MLRLCCVNHGDYLGRGDQYVYNLIEGVARHSTGTALQWEVFTEKELPDGAFGWWNKMALFEPGRFERGQRVVYFDLDTVICGDVSDILGYRGAFAMHSDFYHPEVLQSSVMAWEVSEQTERIWNFWVKLGKPQWDPRGDQSVIAHIMPEADRLDKLFPGQLVSFKANCAEGIPEEARAICFHGLPRPHHIKEIASHW